MAEPKQTTVAIDTGTDDIALPFRLARGNEAYAQRLSNRFKFFIQEWFLDLRLGVPYWEFVFDKNPDKRIVQALITRIIEACPGTRRILKIKFDFDSRARTLSVTELEIETTDGATFRAQPEQFVIGKPIV